MGSFYMLLQHSGGALLPEGRPRKSRLRSGPTPEESLHGLLFIWCGRAFHSDAAAWTLQSGRRPPVQCRRGFQFMR